MMQPLYLKKQLKAIDQLAAQSLGLSSYQLMQRAAASVFSYLRHHNDILVVTGTGHNAGDGFIIAHMALQAGINVTVWNLKDNSQLPPDALKAAHDYQQAGGRCLTHRPNQHFECIVDAILGTGLNRDIDGSFADAIEWINQQKSRIIAVDIASGLDANTGQIRAYAIKANLTVTLICYKPGLFTHHGKDHCGTLFLEDLNITPSDLHAIDTSIHLLDGRVLHHHKMQHHHNSHKGSFGQVLVVGGQQNMLGAVILTARAALRSGCGVVEVVSSYDQAVLISLHCPELLTANDLNNARLLSTAAVIAIGPGLGLDAAAKNTLKLCLKQNKPMVIDADALTLIAEQYHFNNTNITPIQFNDQVVMTPHPKEAARLLNCDIQTIQNDRVAAALALSQRYGANIILKGSGTIVCDTNNNAFICPFGYSGMATAGMGDVLTGLVASLMAQGLPAIDAANSAVVWHAIAAQQCQKGNGLIASDVIEQLPLSAKS